MHELGRPSGAAEVLDGLGWVALASGDLSEAGSKLSESLVIRRRLGLRRIMAASLATTMRLVTKAHPALAAGLSKLVPMIEHATGSEWEAAVGEARAALAGLGTLSNTEPRSLTGRQRQVLQLAAQDLKNTAIATHLDISLGTVNLHLSEAYRRLGVSSRAAAVRVALERGLLADPPRTTKRGNRNQRKRKERGR
jgi:ATP/maltotriose-dependent transcriptional regulator MalT